MPVQLNFNSYRIYKYQNTFLEIPIKEMFNFYMGLQIYRFHFITKIELKRFLDKHIFNNDRYRKPIKC